MYSTENRNSYQPGLCNIGPSEIRVRRLFFRVTATVTLLLTLAAIFWSHSVLLFLFMLFSSFSMIVLHFEIRYRFCILFGFFNLHNFRHLGQLEEVHDKHHARLDRRRVWQIVIKSLAIALLYSSAVHFITEKCHGH